ncbi:putative sfi1 spindle body protein [Lyophyllum shimeji]|uniref:Sfi1 spindle body protein n=1 Tax=Lyophyllum shimeji TaxID=47721 RepID=A0A9P3PFG5_LYOSH|nr:putative sfi1 spindle body protein [Lyophyllum shimeji]
MSHFRPTRASPPSRPARLAEHAVYKAAADVSRSSAASVPELTGLSRDEIDFLDAVIDRAGPSATTFLTVFKAYSEVLKERGLDPQDVLYYGKLLKLGTVKGKNWSDKWNAAKEQYAQRGSDDGSANVDRRRDRTQTRGAVLKNLPRRVPQPKPSLLTDDTLTVHSHADDTEASSSTAEPDLAANRPFTRRLQNPVPRSQPVSSTLDDIGNNSLLVTPLRNSPVIPFQPKRRSLKAEPSDSEGNAPSTTPPSYRAATRHARPPSHPPSNRIFPSDTASIQSPATARKIVAIARDRKGSVVNEEDAWNKIRMQRDEAEADEFRKDRLLERCWEVWKQGFHWIITTNQQIDEARDNLLLRLSLQRWRSVTASHAELYRRIASLSDNRGLKHAFSTWRARLKQKEQDKWRQQMRQKMKIIRDKREQKIRKDAWAKWRQSYRSHLSGQHYTANLVHRFYYCWKKRLSAIIELEDIADNALQASQGRVAERCWNCWRDATELRNSERIMSERVGLRLMGDAMAAWQRKLRDRRLATHFYQLVLMKKAIRSWKASRDRIRNQENRALKHVARQDGVLLRAVTRVWKARERGRLLERVMAARLIKDAWSVWQQRLREQQHANDRAIAFSLRSDSDKVASAFREWRSVYSTHRNAHSFAVQYDSAQLGYKMLLAWRLQLREQLKKVKMARMADRFFATRRAWRAWHDALNARAREKGVGEFNRRRLEKVFQSWLHRTRQQKQRRLAEQTIKDRVIQRVLKDALASWTNRVIEIKLRELQVAQDYDIAVQVLAFKKWQAAYRRHVEELSLLENYLMVKREEHLRRVFNRWLTLARITRHRRVTLKQKEDEMKLSMLASFWDRWRDRFSDEKLRPIERALVVQTQKNTLFRAFGLWHSRTKSLPAIRFRASNVKAKYFAMWRQAMPRVLQAREAREMEKRNVLSKYLDKWVQTHRTKMALKAVARARYLRLPTAAPRQTRPVPPASPGTTSNIFPRPVVQRPPDGKDQTSPSGRFETRLGATRLLRTRSPFEKNPGSRLSTPGTREPSPARSRTSFADRTSARDSSPTRPGPSSDAGVGEGARNQLWLELRGIQRRPRPSSLHTRARDPL